MTQPLYFDNHTQQRNHQYNIPCLQAKVSENQLKPQQYESLRWRHIQENNYSTDDLK